jgi:hypothetical protein
VKWRDGSRASSGCSEVTAAILPAMNELAYRQFPWMGLRDNLRTAPRIPTAPTVRFAVPATSKFPA